MLNLMEGLRSHRLSGRGNDSELAEKILDVFRPNSRELRERSIRNGMNSLFPPPTLAPRYTITGDYDRPTPVDKTPIDSRLLFRSHLESMPSQSMDIKKNYAGFVHILVSGNKVHNPDDDVSVLPAWRQTYVHCLNFYNPPYVSADVLRTLAPETGSYGNEVR